MTKTAVPISVATSSAKRSELRRSVRDFKDHDRSQQSFLLFGYGASLTLAIAGLARLRQQGCWFPASIA